MIAIIIAIIINVTMLIKVETMIFTVIIVIISIIIIVIIIVTLANLFSERTKRSNRSSCCVPEIERPRHRSSTRAACGEDFKRTTRRHHPSNDAAFGNKLKRKTFPTLCFNYITHHSKTIRSH